MKRIGFLVNPIAGLGGQAGMKGSDSQDGRAAALELGYKKTAGSRAYDCIKRIREETGFHMIAPEGEMGGNVLQKAQIPYESLGKHRETTTKEDTLYYARLLKDRDVDLLVFCGGDGTARDICEAVGERFPVLAVPAGVKMYSACYAVSPCQAGELLKSFIRGDRMPFEYREIMDIDEARLDDSSVTPALYGFLQSIHDKNRLQRAKEICPGDSSGQELLTEHIISAMDEHALYIIGPGSTTYCLKEQLEGSGTLRGVDVAKGRKIILKDADEQSLCKLLEKGIPAWIIVTCTGGNGFIFGRGNQQISPRIIRMVSKENLILAVTKEKLATLKGSPMLVDTGDRDMDRYLCGYYRIGVNSRETILYRVDMV
ncbi:MAG: ATP-NAD kinase family protein [Lachnospiraceae bacterium]